MLEIDCARGVGFGWGIGMAVGIGWDVGCQLLTVKIREEGSFEEEVCSGSGVAGLSTSGDEVEIVKFRCTTPCTLVGVGGFGLDLTFRADSSSVRLRLL